MPEPSTLRLHILSDLHMSRQTMPPPEVVADVTILGGDIIRPAATAMQWAASFNRPVLYVPGNHEFYGGDISGVRASLAACAHAYGIHLLDQSTVVIGGVRFIGTTLWTNFKLFGETQKPLAMQQSATFMRDFQVIRNADGSTFSPQDAAALFAQQYRWLEQALNIPWEGPTVVITHHAPSPKSIHPRFADSLISAAFISDCNPLIGRADLWIHGHTHDSFDYTIDGTRIICNPRGYFKNGENENPDFAPRLCIDV